MKFINDEGLKYFETGFALRMNKDDTIEELDALKESIINAHCVFKLYTEKCEDLYDQINELIVEYTYSKISKDNKL